MSGENGNQTMAMLLADGYKHVHAEQFPKGLEKLVSYMTPRMSRLEHVDEMVFFGLQGFIKKYLVDYFDEGFFALDEDEAVGEYERVIDTMLGAGNYGVDKIRSLHRLGYLPLRFSALPEGTSVPMRVPCLAVENTHPDFAWLVQWVESLMSSELWKPCIHAGVGKSYRDVVEKWYAFTVDDDVPHDKAISDFGFRGMSCLEEAQKASAAWLCSFSGTATVPAVPYVEKYYGGNNSDRQFASNAISTEHSVMASNFAVDGNEFTFVKRLLSEIYPHASFSMVSDTYDLFNLIDNVLPRCRSELMAHDGKLLVRPDSGDPVDVAVRTVEHLYALFPGRDNSKGYKTLDPHVGVVYGDGITQQRAEAIYSELATRGFASSVIVFGAGSFSFNCIQEGGVLKPYTRDTFSVAIKSTYGVVNGREIMIYKDPKTDKDAAGHGFKKSQRGLCHVHAGEDGKLECTDGYLAGDLPGGNLLAPVFEDGRLLRETDIWEIRETMHGKGAFQNA